MRCTCGSSGKVSPTTDMDLLRVLADHKGAVPRKGWGTAIMRGKDSYYVAYRRCVQGQSPQPFTHVKYCPPKDGGQLIMPEKCIEQFQVLGEHLYLKMLGINLITSLNKHRIMHGMMPAAVGPLTRELISLSEARRAYSAAPSTRKLHDFIVAFSKINYFSMVAYPVGMHHDHFREGESLESKSAFTVPVGRNGSLGRGDSVLGNRFVWVLTSWK